MHAANLLIYCVFFLFQTTVCVFDPQPALMPWIKQVLVYTSSYAGSRKVQTVAFLIPELVGNITWIVKQDVTPGCPVYPMDVLISSQQGTLPWINESNWAPELIILKRQRYAISLNNSAHRREVSFYTEGTRQFFVSTISLSPEPSKLKRLGLVADPCDYALLVSARGFVAGSSMPLVTLDQQVTVDLPVGQVQYFRLAMPQYTYSLSLRVVNCDVADGSDCPFSATVSSGAADVPPPLASQRQLPFVNATLLFKDRLSPLSGANYLSMVAGTNPIRLTFTLSVQSSCRDPHKTLQSSACELFSPSWQGYSFYGLLGIQPSSPSASDGALYIYHTTPVSVPITIGGLTDSRKFLVIEVAAESGIFKLDFCLGRRLSLSFEEGACEAEFSVREPGQVRKLVPRLPPGIYYLSVVNRMTERSVITLRIYTKVCPSECSRGGQCNYEKVTNTWTCSCYDGFAGELCEGRVRVSPDPLLALLVLCLSNVAFLPTAVMACRRGLFVEALIYAMTMVSSMLYHACDNNYAAQICALNLDTLGKLDFLGAFLSLWVTVLVLLDLTPALKQLVLMAGALFLLVGVLVKRTSFVVIAVPLGVGLSGLVLAWICRCRKSRRCYPPRRVVLTSLLPGGVLALIGFALFSLLDTRATYFLIHSAWHCCVALAILIFLPRYKADFLPGKGCSVERFFVIKDRPGESGGASGNVSGMPLLSSKRRESAGSSECDDDIKDVEDGKGKMYT